eukprot:TRINITY_DN15263_c0_g1_i1.p2 TRINITY_DN15263_c0_g1~~TRINITY_DN15263_c0_g1_i1.p2  ORF type:complete len:174 (+),score=42.97 TRINITY_DN15263_c0_g1_i1:91-612(+)
MRSAAGAAPLVCSSLACSRRWAANSLAASSLGTRMGPGSQPGRESARQSLGWRKPNPAGRPLIEHERAHTKAKMRPSAVLRLRQDFDLACFLKPRLDLSRRPPPTEAEAVGLYRALLKKADRQLVWTDKGWFRRALRFELTVTSRLARDRLDLQRAMFEKGEWLLNNDLGGLR